MECVFMSLEYNPCSTFCKCGGVLNAMGFFLVSFALLEKGNQPSYVLQWSPCVTQSMQFNSLAPGKFEWNFKYVIFKRILMIDG